MSTEQDADANRSVVVCDIRKLRAMAKAGFIKLHRDTGLKVRHWCGPLVTAFYVYGMAEGHSEYAPFKYRGRLYELKCFSGCYLPFVIDVAVAEARKVRHAQLFA